MIYTSPYTHKVRKGSISAAKKVRFKFHVVSHTHWDREWYSTFQQYRMRLVRMIDRLLDLLECTPEFRYFVFDGQTIVLEDYLEIRPENRERLRNLIQAGRLEIGPWYVLPDEFLVSGEALIRNLMAGQRVGLPFGGVMKVGYSPDSFGHVAQLPQILRGFQIDNFIFTRGMGDEQDELGTEFLWVAPDGSRVLAVNQFKTYCNGNQIGFESGPESAAEMPRFDLVVDFFKQEAQALGAVAKPGTDDTRHLLINNGCDHQEPQADLPRILAYANSVLTDSQVEHTTFSRFVHTLRRAGLSLADWSGEIHAGKRHDVLAGVLSTRVYLKQQNDACENLLSRQAEPLGVLAGQLTGAESFAGFLQQAWKSLLKNHPHDSICGCSIDQVHRDMLPRFEEARQIGRLALASSLDVLAGRVKHESAPTVIAVNTLAFARSAVVRSIVLVPPQRPAKEMTLVDAAGEVVPTHVIKVRTLRSHPGYALPEAFLAVCTNPGSDVRPLDYAAKRAQLDIDIANFNLTALNEEKPWRAVELEYLVEQAPAVGYRALTLRPQATARRQDGVSVRGNMVENKFIRVKFAGDGSFDLYHKATKKEYRRLNVLEDTADLGDEYDYSPAPKDKGIWSRNQRGQLKITHRSPLAVEVEVEGALRLPVSYDRNRKRRHAHTVTCPVHWKFTVTAASPWVAVELKFTNLARDHRLRVRVPAALAAQHTLTGQAFGMVQRPLKRPAGKDWRQAPAPTAPLQGFCAVEEQRRGLAVLVHGLYEYEAIKMKGGVELAVTLLRAVGWLSRGDLATRRDHAGPFYATPEAQCLGPQTFRYAIFPYAGAAEKLNLAAVAESYRVPLFEEQCTGAGGSLPAQFSLLQCEPACLTITAIKRCEQRNTTIVRLYNASTERVRGHLAWGLPISHAWRVNLAEERLEEITVYAKSRLELDIPAWRIVTLELEAGRKFAG